MVTYFRVPVEMGNVEDFFVPRLKGFTSLKVFLLLSLSKLSQHTFNFSPKGMILVLTLFLLKSAVVLCGHCRSKKSKIQTKTMAK